MFSIRQLFKRKSNQRVTAQMLMDVAGDFIPMGDSVMDKQEYLNCAVSAWNISCLELSKQKKAIKKYISSYRKMNPTFTKKDLQDEEHNITLLMKNKLELYPEVKTQIASAKIMKIGNKEHVTVASLRVIK